MPKLSSKQLFFFFALLALTTCQTEGDSCKSDADCPSFNLCINFVCTHQGLTPISLQLIFSTIFISIICAFAVAGGVGVGAVFVPFFEILLNFQVKSAVVRATAVLLGSGLGNLMYILFLRHQETKRPVINYNINLFVIPGLLIGVAIGSLVQKIIAPLISIILLAIIMAYSAKKYISKALSIIRSKRE